MSLTQAEAVFASVHETALNDSSPLSAPIGRATLLRLAILRSGDHVAETRCRRSASPAFRRHPMARCRLTIPHIDLFKQTERLPPELSLGRGPVQRHGASRSASNAGEIRIDPKPPRPPRREGEPRSRDERDGASPACRADLLQLQVFAIGHLEQVLARQARTRSLSASTQVEIVDIKPEELEELLECLLFMILQAVLAGIRMPLDSAFGRRLQLIRRCGPLIEDDQVKLRGLLESRESRHGRDHRGNRRRAQQCPPRYRDRADRNAVEERLRQSWAVHRELRGHGHAENGDVDLIPPDIIRIVDLRLDWDLDLSFGFDLGSIPPRVLPAADLRPHSLRRTRVHAKNLHRLADHPRAGRFGDFVQGDRRFRPRYHPDRRQMEGARPRSSACRTSNSAPPPRCSSRRSAAARRRSCSRSPSSARSSRLRSMQSWSRSRLPA